MFERKIKGTINNWIENGKDAFLLRGIRQVGKTYIIRECLKESSYPFVELNFIEHPEFIELLNNSINTNDFIMRLSLTTNEKLEPYKTIFFLDEVQECKDIITKIKFLVEDGRYKFILSGSLLGVEINDLRSAPVGYMSVHDMYPLCFEEFSKALGIKQDIIDLLKDCFDNRKAVDEFVHRKMMDLFYLYLIIGGMPEAVATYIDANDLSMVSTVHKKILDLYRIDFTKYENNYKLKIREIFDSMPGQLNQMNKRFKFSNISKNVSFDRLENSFLWLKDAGVAIPVYNVSEPTVPLIISENRSLFKLFYGDVGLLTSNYSNDVKIAILNKNPNINNGALFENVCAQELLCKNFKLYYFNSKKQGELDFVVEYKGKVLPIEIKSGKSYKKHSALNNILSNDDYMIDEAFIFCDNNVEVEDNRIYLPIYMMMFLDNRSSEKLIYKIDLGGLQA